MAVVVGRHIKRGSYRRAYWGHAFREHLSKHTSCGVCCGHHWWTSWGRWGKRHLLVCWQVAWIMMCFSDIKRQQSPAAGPRRFGFVFFMISFQTAYNLYISTVKWAKLIFFFFFSWNLALYSYCTWKRNSRLYYIPTLGGVDDTWLQVLTSFIDTPCDGSAVWSWCQRRTRKRPLKILIKCKMIV